MEEISLQICNEIFLINKEVLCEHSDYFRAMFSGNYVENQKKEVIFDHIDILDLSSMKIILQYMKTGLIDLSEYSLSTISSLAVASDYLQITKLIKQIEYTLDIQTNESNWIEIMTIAENSSFLKLKQLCAAYGLFSFKSMKPEYVPTIHKVVWYLSHPYLDTQSELDVFRFGLDWITLKQIGADGADALLIILGCLDMKSITKHDLKEMKNVMKGYKNSLAAKVVYLLYDLSISGGSVTENNLLKQKTELCQKFTERVWSETLNIVKNSKSRCLQYTPVVPVWYPYDSKRTLPDYCMYTFNEDKGIEKWLEVADEHLHNWRVVSWGLTKLVVLGNAPGRGGLLMTDLKVYDTLRKEWTRHGVQLPYSRYPGLVVVGDTLYMVGGEDAFRSVLETAIAYDLKHRTYRMLARFPDPTRFPAACSHKGAVYIAGTTNIYRLEDSETMNCWRNVPFTRVAQIPMTCIRSFKDYIYCFQLYFLYRFRPDIDKKMEVITCFSYIPASVCHLGHKLYVFTLKLGPRLTVEEVTGEKDEKPKVLFTKGNTIMRGNDVAGSCLLVLSLPPLCMDPSEYHKQYLRRYIDLV